MSLTTTSSAVVYDGNNSAVTPYPITFPFLETGHIYVATLAAGGTAGEDDVLLTAGTDYTVTRFDSGLGQVVTTAAVPASSQITIFRDVPLTQPEVYPVGGAFPAESHERALDRMMMILQGQGRKLAELLGQEDGSVLVIPGTHPEALRDVAIFDNAAARAAAVPVLVGQLGVQKDTKAIYIGTALTAGSWQLSVPAPVTVADKITIGYASDTGTPGGYQTAVANWLQAGSFDAVVLGGGNSMSGDSDFDTDWAAFDDLVATETVYPALGKDDVSGDGLWNLHTEKFDYLPGNKRYYSKVLGTGLVEIFVLHSGRDSSWDIVETDGIAVGSIQHAWFVAALAASTAKYKFVFMHSPPVTTATSVNAYDVTLRWPEFCAVDAVFCGLTALNEWISWEGVPVLNASGSVLGAGDATLTVVNETKSNIVWQNDRLRLAVRLIVTKARVLVEYVEVSTGRVIYARDLHDATLTDSKWGAEVIPPATNAAVGVHHVGASPVGMIVNNWFISVAAVGTTALNGIVYVNGLPHADFSIPAGDFWTVASPDVTGLPLGALVNVEITLSDSYPAHRGLTVYARGRIVR